VLNLYNVNCDSRLIPFFSQDLCTYVIHAQT